MNIELSAKAAHVFKTHPKVDELHATADEMLFFKATDAAAHAGDLKDKKVTPIKRSEVVKPIEVELVPEKTEEETTEAVVVEVKEEKPTLEPVIEENPAPKKK